jgi:membrane fusion protein (multidrug efflux system)
LYPACLILHIYIGQPVRIKVDALPGKVFEGKVTAISEATGSKYSLVPTDNSAGNFVKVQQRIPVRIDIINISEEDAQHLRAGMMVETEALRK